VPAGTAPADALRHTVALARAADELGYSRYWLAEHHNTGGLAGTAPEVLAAHVASATSRIRVGSGGVLLSHYSPLKVAEAFGVLSALFPGRIDLGIGRAAGADPVTAAALRPGPAAYGDDHFPRRVVDLLGWLGAGLDPDHPAAAVRAMPDGGDRPDVWLLGSSPHSAGLAAALGLPYSFAQFITPDFGPQVVGRYRRNFRPSGADNEPRVNAAVAAVCADTDEAAERLALSGLVWRLSPEERRGPVPSVEDAQAMAAALDPARRARLAQERAGIVVGAPERVAAELTDLAGSFGVDELLVVTVCHDPAARLRSYELVASAVGLPAADQPAPDPAPGYGE
jgi:luciferase family oxidoreductase group 1